MRPPRHRRATPDGYTPPRSWAIRPTSRRMAVMANIPGTSGDDVLPGGAQNDTITGADGNDVLAGLDGNDDLNGGRGTDTVTGEAGNDIIVWNNGDGSDLMDGGADADTQVVNGALADGDVFQVDAGMSGAAVFQRINLVPFTLTMDAVE